MNLRKIVLLVATMGLMACSQEKMASNLGAAPSDGIVNGTNVDLTTEVAGQHVVGLVFVTRVAAPPAAPGSAPTKGDGSQQRVRQAICTGTLVTPDVVLTAAHCAADAFDAGFVVFSTDLIHATQPQIRHITAKGVNSGFDIKNINQSDLKDLALVKFEGGLPAGYSPAEMLKDSSALTEGAKVLEMGYGKSTPADPKNDGVGILREATVDILDNSSAATEIVTDESHGQGVCEGDSGGPAFVNVGGKFLLWGVASRVYGDAPDPKDPMAQPVVLCDHASIETNIVPYAPWIRTMIARLEALPAAAPQVASLVVPNFATF